MWPLVMAPYADRRRHTLRSLKLISRPEIDQPKFLVNDPNKSNCGSIKTEEIWEWNCPEIF